MSDAARQRPAEGGNARRDAPREVVAAVSAETEAARP
jgi:hypothetical protein